MGVVYKTREDGTAAINVWTVLAAEGDVTAPGQLMVPRGKTKIKQMVVGIGASVVTAAAGGSAFLVRLSGGGLKYGEQVFAVGSRGNTIATNAQTASTNAWVYPVDLDVVAGAVITIEACPVCGVVSETTGEVAVTLAFV